MAATKRRPRGHIRELRSGSFQAIVYAGVDPLARKERYLRETAKTYAAAELALTKLQSQVDDERHPKTNITVGQAIDRWLEVVDLAETTRGRYEDLIRIYIRPTFGRMPAARLDAESLERFYASLQRCRSLCGRKPTRGHTCRPLAGATVRQIHYVISGALERAVRWGHLGLNKATFAVPPSPNRPDPDPPSAEEAARLLSAAWEDPDWGLLLWLTMTTGRRRGEVSGLRWKHVDFARALLLVERNNVQPKAAVIEKKTKSGTSPHVALDPYTISLLEEHRARAVKRAEAPGSTARFPRPPDPASSCCSDSELLRGFQASSLRDDAYSERLPPLWPTKVGRALPRFGHTIDLTGHIPQRRPGAAALRRSRRRPSKETISYYGTGEQPDRACLR
jgi:integrase